MHTTLSRFLVASAALAFSLAALPGCASKFNDITIDTERLAEYESELSSRSTYAWAASAAVVNDPQGRWTPPDLDIGAEIRFLISREMRRVGFTEVVENPDVLLIYAVGVDMESLGVVVRGEDTGKIVDLPSGGIVVGLTDPGTMEVLWAGAAEGQIRAEGDSELARQRLDHAISKMFRRYPN